MQISWQHIISLLDFDTGLNRCGPELRRTLPVDISILFVTILVILQSAVILLDVI